MLRKTAIIMAIAILPACSTAAGPEAVPGYRTMECVPIDEAQQVWDDFTVTPLEVLEDSRCPVEADCIWEGRIRLKAQLELGHEIVSVTLDSNEPLRINGGFLSIAEIAPDMSNAWAPIRQEDYRFAFRFALDIMERPGKQPIDR